MNEHFGHHVVALALRNVIAFGSNPRPHEDLKCFAVQASIAPKQHMLKRSYAVPPVRRNELAQDNASTGVYSRIDKKNSYPGRIPLQDGPLGNASPSIFGKNTYMRIENA